KQAAAAASVRQAPSVGLRPTVTARPVAKPDRGTRAMPTGTTFYVSGCMTAPVVVIDRETEAVQPFRRADHYFSSDSSSSALQPFFFSPSFSAAERNQISVTISQASPNDTESEAGETSAIVVYVTCGQGPRVDISQTRVGALEQRVGQK
ncbi:hypothetical protein BaRGS_00009416, partial [Batillaria attramentaria]